MCNAGLTDSNSLTHLINRISPELENEVDLIEQSNYYDDTSLGQTFQSSMCISMVSLNCQCLNTKILILNVFAYLIPDILNSNF